jgi:hypothetical protein
MLLHDESKLCVAECSSSVADSQNSQETRIRRRPTCEMMAVDPVIYCPRRSSSPPPIRIMYGAGLGTLDREQSCHAIITSLTKLFRSLSQCLLWGIVAMASIVGGMKNSD